MSNRTHDVHPGDVLHALLALLAAIGRREITTDVALSKARELITRSSGLVETTNVDARQLAAVINGITHLAPRSLRVNGREVSRVSYARDVATSWRTGSVSVDVRTLTGNRTTNLWIKAGEPARVEVVLPQPVDVEQYAPVAEPEPAPIVAPDERDLVDVDQGPEGLDSIEGDDALTEHLAAGGDAPEGDDARAVDLRPLDREPVAVRAPFDVRRALIHNPETARADRVAAIREALAGVELGAHDERTIVWLAGWDTSSVGAVVSLLDRVRAAGSDR